jgi:putative phosphoesterase
MIAVISDSHVPQRADGIPSRFIELLGESEQAVHCGDFTEESVKEDLEEHCDLIAVKGNCDFFDLPNSEKFERNDVKFGVYHGTGITPRGHHPTLVKICGDLGVDVLLNGHTHQQEAVKKDGKILLNPGSCTGASGGTASMSPPKMMKVHVEDDQLRVEMLSLESGELKASQETFEI